MLVVHSSALGVFGRSLDGVFGLAGDPGTGASFAPRTSDEREALYLLWVEPKIVLVLPPDPERVRRLARSRSLLLELTEPVDDDVDKGRLLGVKGILLRDVAAGVRGTDMVVVLVQEYTPTCSGFPKSNRETHHVVALVAQ